MLQIVFFWSKHFTFWAHNRAKSLHTEEGAKTQSANRKNWVQNSRRMFSVLKILNLWLKVTFVQLQNVFCSDIKHFSVSSHIAFKVVQLRLCCMDREYFGWLGSRGAIRRADRQLKGTFFYKSSFFSITASSATLCHTWLEPTREAKPDQETSFFLFPFLRRGELLHTELFRSGTK